MSKPKKILICGNYGATNVGDEAILEGIITLVRLAQPEAEITVMSANPAETATTHGVKAVGLFPAGVRSLLRSFGGGLRETLQTVKNADLFILGGGGLFSDEKPMAIVIWGLQTRVARFYKRKIFFLGQSVGPLKSLIGRVVTGRVFSYADVVSVRDHASFELVQKMEFVGVHELADPAFAIRLEDGVGEREEKYVVITVRPWIKGGRPLQERVNKKIAHFIDWLWREKRLKSVLVPFQVAVDNDEEVLSQIFDQVQEREAVTLFEYSSDYRKVVELIRHSAAVVGMRLHSLIFSTICRRPFVALSYSSKVRNFAAVVDMEEFVLDWPDFEVADLCEHFSVLLEQQEKVISGLEEALLRQRMKALEHVDILKNLLT